MPLKSACAILLLTLGASREFLPEKPTVLQVSSTRRVELPALNYFGSAQCDSEGDLFFHTDSGSFRRNIVFKLSHDVEDSLMYKLTPELDRTTSFLSFAVTPDGTVHILANDDKHLLVISFDSDGTMKDEVLLDTPERVLADQFEVFANGVILLDGYYSAGASQQLRGKPFQALFDASGKLIKRFSDISERDHSQQKTGTVALKDGGAAMGDDGNAYLLRSHEVVVLSSAGTAVRRLRFSKPEPKTIATGIFVSKGLLAIVLSETEKNNQIVDTDLVLDANTGLKVGYYAAPQQAGATSIVCFSREDGFTFLKSENLNLLTLYTAPLR
jgi:hypothetical protein